MQVNDIENGEKEFDTDHEKNLLRIAFLKLELRFSKLPIIPCSTVRVSLAASKNIHSIQIDRNVSS